MHNILHFYNHKIRPVKNIFICVFAFLPWYLSGQSDLTFSRISEMKWELDYEVYLKMKNDSTYTYDIRQLFHIKEDPSDSAVDFIFYPVNLDEEYINNLGARPPSVDSGGQANPPELQRRLTSADSTEASTETPSFETLWAALHESLGGGWVHFINCLLYSLETGQLDLTSPLMRRPETDWKPEPPTDSYKRTRKWQYYIPVDQKLAIKEYKLRMKRDEPGDLKNIPEEFIDLFLGTSNKKYHEYIENRKVNIVAKIDLVKILLGANFLGEAQINYIRSQVLDAIKNYSINRIPSVLVFDDFDAAAAISIDLNGYKLQSIAFNTSANLTYEQMEDRRDQISKILSDINTYNQNSFRKQLSNYYRR
jgi:hypothetical protein